ncbi:MAG: ribosomal L7Ae/L30e/S12e/Gadd45 family protein [Phascolarctobacterium sp.]|nr:ribosomal L7Ae/L30e/S12e/Gadd45 family protein [Phascolarctobacterium sp.]
MENNKLISSLGLAQRAGKALSGDFAVSDALKRKKVKLLLVAKDAAYNSKKELYRIAKTYNVTVLEILSREEIGIAIGKPPRIAVAIIDNNFADMIKSL